MDKRGYMDKQNVSASNTNGGSVVTKPTMRAENSSHMPGAVASARAELPAMDGEPDGDEAQ